MLLLIDKEKQKGRKFSPEAIKLGEKGMIDEIIAIHAITDDLLKALGHTDDCRSVMSD